jgi:Ca-activated chloride channel family protein
VTYPTSFAHPWVLILLLLPVLLAVWWRGRHAPVSFPFDHRQHGRQRLWRAALGLTHLAPLLLLALAIIALAGPQEMQQPREKRKLTNIQIVLDVSGSMTEDMPPRFTHAAAAIDELTRAREGDAMGLIFFGTEQIRWVPITTDLQALRASLTYADPNKQPGHMGGTAIGAALRFTTEVMESESHDGDRVIVLVSDGQSPDLWGGQHFAVADVLNEARIRLFYLHIALADAPSPEVMEMADLTGGRGFVAHDREGALAVFRQIDQMTKAEFESLASQRVDGFGLLGLVVLAVCGVHLVGLLGLRYTPW